MGGVTNRPVILLRPVRNRFVDRFTRTPRDRATRQATIALLLKHHQRLVDTVGVLRRWLPWVIVSIVGVASAWADVRTAWWEGGRFPDATADKYVTIAATDGFGAHRPFVEIADHYSVPGRPWQHPHPRPPGALTAQLPLTLIPDEWLLAAVGVITGLSVVATGWATSRLTGWSPWLFAAGASVAMVLWNEWTRGNVWWLLTGALVTVGWVGVREGRRWGPWLFGLAAAAKLWPALLVPALWVTGRKRSAAETTAVVGAFTVAGLLLPGVSLVSDFGTSGGLEFLSAAGNLSLAGWLLTLGVPYAPVVGAAVALTGWAVALRRVRGDVEVVLAVTIVAGLLASPLTWPAYWTAALPTLRWVLSDSHASVGSGDTVIVPTANV